MFLMPTWSNSTDDDLRNSYVSASETDSELVTEQLVQVST